MSKKSTSMLKKKEEKALHEQLIDQLLALSTAGFGVVAALAWNSLIQDFVKEFIEPRIPGSGLISKLIYALLITIFAVLITYQLSHLVTHLKNGTYQKNHQKKKS